MTVVGACGAFAQEAAILSLKGANSGIVFRHAVKIVPRSASVRSAAGFLAARIAGPGSLLEGLGAPVRVHPAGVGHHLDATLHACRVDLLHEADEVAGIPRRGISVVELSEDGHGHLGQVVQHEVVQGTALHQTAWSVQVVSPEALPPSDPNTAPVSHSRVPPTGSD